MPPRPATPESDRARYWTKVNKNGPIVPHCAELGECWDWTGPFLKTGYGAIAFGRKVRKRAHVVSYEWHYGPVPTGLMVLHHCDRKQCVRPTHLHADTRRKNTDEAIERGRFASGDRNGSRTHPERRPRGDAHWSRRIPERTVRGSHVHGARLTDDDVREIRRLAAEGIMQKTLAEMFGVSRPNISAIAARRSWKHLP